MTCTLLIVDDEPIVRYGIRHSIDWEAHGITVVGEAENGAVALKKSLLLRPDIILCDIKMPIVNGLTFIRQLKEGLPGASIVILTGYADSEYLMQALRSGVKDYLLKPATMESILEAVCRVADNYRKKQRAEYLQSRKEDLLAENLLVLQSAFFTELMQSKLPPESIREKAQYLNISLAGPQYQFLLLAAQHQPLRIMTACKKAYEAYAPFVVQVPADGVVAVILNVSACVPVTRLSAESERVLRQTEQIIAVSDATAQLSGLAGIYPRALSLVRRGFWFEHAGCEAISRFDLSELPTEELDRMERTVLQAAREGDPDVMACRANEYFTFMQKHMPEMEQTEAHFSQLIRSIRMMTGAPAALADDVSDCTVSQLRKRFFDACKISFLSSNRGQGQSGRALRYIEQHYQEELSLESVAGELYLSPSYLSRMLKEKTNHGFQYWVNYFRIQKAKELLLDDRYRSYEIAEIVGYNSYKIFSSHFTRFTHRTASEYRQHNAVNAGSEEDPEV